MEKIILIIAIFLGIFFRVWQIDRMPPGLAMDEAAFGYNAWSIATNLKDEYGKFLPLAFRSFADFKLPAYGYMTAGVMKLFGPGIWQTRTVSVLAGLVSCLLLYLIVKEYASKRMAALAAVIMLWSPWGILFSRGAFEGNLGLTFFLLGIYGLVRARTKDVYLVLAAISLSLANYSYITYKFVGLGVFLAWLLYYRGKLKAGLLALGLFLFLSAPSYLMFAGISGSNRVTSLLKLNPAQTGYPAVVQISANYLTFFSPRNLFFRPDPVKQRHFNEISVFYPWMLVLWFAGVLVLFKNRRSELARGIIVLMLIAPIPAAISQDPFATLRAIPLLPAYCVLLAWGMTEIERKIKWGNLLMIGLLMISFIEMYGALMVLKHGQTAEWNNGFDKLALNLRNYQDREVFVDINRDLYPDLALALKYPPEQMQKMNAGFNLAGYYSDPNFPETINFANYHVGKTDRSQATVVKGAILVTTPERIFANEPASHHWREAFLIKDDRGVEMFLGYYLN